MPVYYQVQHNLLWLTDRDRALARIQIDFEFQSHKYGNFKGENINSLDYESTWTWKDHRKRIREFNL